MNEKITALYQKYLKLTGDANAASLLVASETLASFDETLVSIYQDAKSAVPGMVLKNLLKKWS